jgi:hypothetical protein
MSRNVADRAWARAHNFYRAHKRRKHKSDELFEWGCAARVLAASKPGGLLLNVDVPGLSFFIVDGMDISSQLISVVNDADDHAALKEVLAGDMRISVHAQHPVEFLGDVREHRFDLMTFGELDPYTAKLAAAGLAPGGLLAVFHDAAPADAYRDGLEQTLTDCGLLIGSGIGRLLVAARAPDHLKPKRRGGRRKRPPFRG